MRLGLFTDDDEAFEGLRAALLARDPPLVLFRARTLLEPALLLLVDEALRPSRPALPPQREGLLAWLPRAPGPTRFHEDALDAALAEARRAVKRRPGIAAADHHQRSVQRILELSTESVEITDTAVRLLYANPAFEQITGWPLEDAVGHPTGELFRAGTHDPSYYAEILRVLRAGQVWRGPLIGRRRDGELSFQEATLAPVLNDDGVALGFVAIKRDVARDTLAQQALASREHRLSSMLASAADGVFVHDRAGVIVDANSSAAAMLGLTEATALTGQRIDRLFECCDPDPLSVHMGRLGVGDPITLEGRLNRPDGRHMPVSVRMGAFVFGGEHFILSLARDVTERVALEASLRARTAELTASLEALRAAQAELVQQEKAAALGRLVAGIAHEINTPLGVTLTAVSLAWERMEEIRAAITAPAPSRRAVLHAVDGMGSALDLAISNARRAASLISDFKKVAVDQTGELERSIELYEYLGSVLTAISPVLRAEQLTVHLSGEPVTLTTRPGAIAQVLTNAIQNCALHAFSQGDGPREVWLRCQREGAEARIEVEDRGVGMSPELLARAFEPFVTTRMGTGGTGLGLHIVHSIVVQVLKGRLSLRSAPNCGTTLILRIPLSLPTAAG
jgi:PAS domain S-box-containing protein